MSVEAARRDIEAWITELEDWYGAGPNNEVTARLRGLLADLGSETHEGMVSVVDFQGRTVGSLGEETWQKIVTRAASGKA